MHLEVRIWLRVVHTKTMRDHHEAQKLIHRINEARAERMLKEETE